LITLGEARFFSKAHTVSNLIKSGQYHGSQKNFFLDRIKICSTILTRTTIKKEDIKNQV